MTGAHLDGTPDVIRERSTALRAVYDEHLAPEASTSPDTTNSTGSRSTSTASLDDTELLEKARNAANGEKFQRLYKGDTSGYESHSEADMALCSLLAFWTGGDPGQMDRLFRDSGLIREKWDEQHYADGSTYGEKTIQRAIAGSDEFYDPSDVSSKAGPIVQNQVLNSSIGRDHADARDKRIQELQQRLREVMAEKEELETELAEERARREELERELDERGSNGSLVPFW